ncbi:MAG: hypothetical protein V3U49_04420 [Nitrososphaerales archaeon]
MVQPIYEYVFSGLVIVLMVTASLSTIFPITLAHLSQTKSLQLQGNARNILDKLLLTPGDPYDWGTDLSINSTQSDGLRDFGLAGSLSFKTLYRLDPSKVERLINTSTIDNPFYIPPERAAEIMGIEKEFGFSLSLEPVLQISDHILNKTIVMRITTPETIPVANVNVTAVLIRLNSLNEEEFEIATSSTDWNGTAVLDFSSADNFESVAYIILTDYYDIRTRTVGGSNVTEAVLIGNNIVVKYPDGTNLEEAIGNSRSPLYAVGNRTYLGEFESSSASISAYQLEDGGKTFVIYPLSNADPDISLATFITDIGGETKLVAAFRPFPTTYETGPIAGSTRYTLTRLVEVAGVSMRVNFHIWRLSE